MGREIRKVPPNWKHPKKTMRNVHFDLEERFQPMFDRPYQSACEEWKQGFKAFYEKGGLDSHGEEYWDCHGTPPDKEFYRPYSDEDATWFCVYETVSEGTPVTPAFATKEELADYLSRNGDFWDQDRRKRGVTEMNCEPWGEEAANKFVFGAGWLPSMIVQNGKICNRGES